MKVGVNLLNFGPAVSPDSLSRWTKLVESLGYHLVMISDHIAITDDVQVRYPAPFYDPFTTLAWLSGITEKIELGTTVIVVPYRNPLLMARMGANIDQISGGRFIFGVGVGWAAQEFEVLGVDHSRRGAITDDYLAAIKTLWTNELASYDGKYVSFENVRTTPMSIQSPHPPIWIGGSSDAAFRRTVRFGDAWHPIRIRVDWLRDTGLPTLRRFAEQAGRPTPALCPRIKLRLFDSPLPEDERVAGEGSLDQVRGDLEALQEMGAEYVLLDNYYDDPEATRNHEASWRMLVTMAEQVLDLENQTLR